MSRWPCRLGYQHGKGAALQHEVVHVWRIGLEHPLLSGAACERVLAADELARAARFVLDRDRRQYGVSRQREIGIDIEHVRPLEDAAAIAEQFFSPGERELLRQAPRRAALERFFTYWVRKEAVIKATGDGLSLPLDRFDVSWPSTESPEPVLVEDGSRTL